MSNWHQNFCIFCFVSLAGGSDSGCGITGGGDLCIPPSDHSHPVHCNQAHYGPVSGGNIEARVKGGQAVVRSVQIGLGGDVDGGLGGRTDRGGGVYGQDGDGLNRWEGYCSTLNIRDGV